MVFFKKKNLSKTCTKYELALSQNWNSGLPSCSSVLILLGRSAIIDMGLSFPIERINFSCVAAPAVI